MAGKTVSHHKILDLDTLRKLIGMKE